MRKRLIGALTTLAVSGGLSFGQTTPSNRVSVDYAPIVPLESGIVRTSAMTEGYGSACAGANCAGCDGSANDPCFWFNAEYLLWWMKNGPLPAPLATTGPVGSQGIIGNGASVLFGNSDVDYHEFSGGRFNFGLWHNEGHTFGMDSTGFFLENHPVKFSAGSTVNGSPVLARPFLNAITGLESASLVSSPGQFTGAIGIQADSSFYGWDTNLLVNITRDGGLSLDLLAGFRFAHLHEDIRIFQNSTVLMGGTAGFEGTPVAAGSLLNVNDSFQTRNEFYGGQLGARGQYVSGRVALSFLAKVGLGSTHEVREIEGASTLTSPGVVPVTVPGGLLAVSSNTGRTSHDNFSVIPELGLNVGYHLCSYLRAYAGYTYIYWTEVARPGTLISTSVNPTLVPASFTFGIPNGPVQPIAPEQRSGFWAQGINFGLEFSF